MTAEDQRGARTRAAGLTLKDVSADRDRESGGREQRGGRACSHAVMPLLGALTLVVPFIELFQPGQPVPYSLFPYAAVGILIAAAAYAHFLLARNPRAGSSEGSIAARTRA